MSETPKLDDFQLDMENILTAFLHVSNNLPSDIAFEFQNDLIKVQQPLKRLISRIEETIDTINE